MSNPSKLPPGVREKYKSRGESSMVFGQYIDDMDRDDLFAVIGMMGETMAEMRKMHESYVDFLEKYPPFRR